MSRLLRGAYRRPRGFSPVNVGFMRTGGHRNGISLGVGRRGWYLGVLRATPCRHKRQLDELQQRVTRTVGYFDELLNGPLEATTRTVVVAARRSLLTEMRSS